MGGPLKYILKEDRSFLRISFKSTSKDITLATFFICGTLSTAIDYKEEYDSRLINVEVVPVYRSIAPELYVRISSEWSQLGMFRVTATLESVFVIDLVESVEGYVFTAFIDELSD